MKKFLIGTLAMSFLLCVTTGQAMAANPIAEFDPQTHCATTLSIETDDQLVGILSNISDYAVVEDTFRVLCFEQSNEINIDDNFITITNNSPLPLIIYGLTVLDHMYSSSQYIIETQGDKIVLYNTKVEHEWYPGSFMWQSKGLRLYGSQNMLINSKVYGFHHSLVIEGDLNVIDGGIYDGIELSGYGNEVQNSLIDGCASYNNLSDIGVIKNYTCTTQYLQTGGIWANCYTTNPQPGPYCTIANNKIVHTNHAIYIPSGSERVKITENNITTDSNKHRITNDNYSVDPYDPIEWHQVGVTNAHSYKEDAGFRIMGSLEGISNIDPATDRIELFNANGDNAGFITACSISQHSGSSIEMTDLDEDTKYTIQPGELYYDCGLIDIGPDEDFSLTYTNSQGSTSLYTRPATVELDWHFHCANSIAQFNASLSPLTSIYHRISLILQNVDAYATDFPSKRVLCFPDESYVILQSTSYYDEPYINNVHKKIVLHNLHIEAAVQQNDPPPDGTAILKISGRDVHLHNSTITTVNDNSTASIGIELVGVSHRISGSTIDHAGTCLELYGYRHTIERNVMSDCNTGLYADCAWFYPADLATEPSCVIGPDNYFQNVYYPGDHQIHLPSTAQNVTITDNMMGLHPLGDGGYFLTRFEDEANGDIQPIDVEQSGIFEIEPNTTCSPEGIDCVFMGKLDDRYCESPSTVELFVPNATQYNGYFAPNLGLYDQCAVLYTTGEIQLARHWETEDPVYVTLQPGDCAFRCLVDWYTARVRNESSQFAYTITDSTGNTSEYTRLIQYYRNYAGAVTFASSTQPEGGEEEYSEDSGDFVAEGDGDGGAASDDTWVEDEGDNPDEVVASLASSLYSGMHCSLTPKAGVRLPAVYVLIIIAIFGLFSIRRWKCRKHSNIY